MSAITAPLEKAPRLYIYRPPAYAKERCFKAGAGLLYFAAAREVSLKLTLTRRPWSLGRTEQ